MYGLRRMLSDIKFMMDISLGIYWKFCLGVFVPLSLMAMCVYIVITYEPLTYKVKDIFITIQVLPSDRM